jgi:hypothetical protein
MFNTGNPFATNPLLQAVGQYSNTIAPRPALTPTASQPDNMPDRGINYLADYSGCGHWRLIWPEMILNAHNKMTMHSTTVMCLDPRYYINTKAVRVQRQATEHQLKFVQFLKQLGQQNGFRLLYEIDDLVFHEDIPDYNKFKTAFIDPNIRKQAQAIMNECDEITVTCKFMKDYYAEKTGHKKITVIPNYPPKFWMGNYYNLKKISENYDTCEKKPRILYAGSGAHFDVENRVGQNDDFAHVLQAIADTKDKYQWVFFGAFPMMFRPLVEKGIFEYHPWQDLYHYPGKINDLRINMMIAPLQNNNFNKSKSDLKYIEACCYGLPIACQNLCTYEDAPFKFDTGDEMIKVINEVLGKKSKYMTHCERARSASEKRWLENEDNINKYVELYKYPYGDERRVLLNKVNGLT